MQSHSPFGIVAAKAFLLAVVAAFYVTSARAEKALYSFAGGTDGVSPFASLVYHGGKLYGTTRDGGAGFGTVFELTHSSSGWTESVLYRFTGGSDGGHPLGSVVFDSEGNLYGTATTNDSDNFNCGTVFELSPASGGGWTEQTLHVFTGVSGDGCTPTSGLTLDSHGNLYGVTQSGGTGAGVVFELVPSGGGWTESTIWSFNGQVGSNPQASVVFDSFGNMYGTTVNGGVYGQGNVFKLTPVSGGWTGTSIFSFTGGDNGCMPYGGVVFDSGGNLYGTAQACGADNVGTVFKLTPTVGQWRMSVLHTFGGGIDGGYPYATVAFDGFGNLWGAAERGGLYGFGTVFRLVPPSSGSKWKLAGYSFTGGADGGAPYAGVVFVKYSSGTFAYGTTVGGGTNNLGVVYQIFVK